MLDKLKYVGMRVKNLGFYLAVTSFLLAGTIVIDAIYEVATYNYRQKIPTIATALILMTATIA